VQLLTQKLMDAEGLKDAALVRVSEVEHELQVCRMYLIPQPYQLGLPEIPPDPPS
jgi:hypothetical protein